jgi:hypothetical protein
MRKLSKAQKDKLFYRAARSVTWTGFRQPDGWPKLVEYVESLLSGK